MIRNIYLLNIYIFIISFIFTVLDIEESFIIGLSSTNL